jgi:nucleotide-binding universal stress UspA family protein
MNVTKILVPIDYSGRSDRALQWGASLAEKYWARLLPLHVIPETSESLSESRAETDVLLRTPATIHRRAYLTALTPRCYLERYRSELGSLRER